MEVVVFTGVGEVEVRSEPLPDLRPDQVLVDVDACGICTFERRLFAGDKQWYPVAPGHEIAGVVTRAGPAVSGIPGSPEEGDRVTVDLLTRCGTCGPCRRGKTSLCRMQQGRILSDGTVFFGGLADQITVDARSVHPIGDAPILHGAMGEPIACCVHSLRQAGFGPGDRVGVIGAGFMGRLHLALARTWGASAVSLIDVSPDRLKRAERYGATRTAHPDDALEVCGEQDVVVVTAPAGVDLAVEMAAVGGTVVLFSAFDDDVQAAVGADRSHREEVAIVGAYSQEPEDWRLASSLIRSGLITEDLDGLITATFDFDTIGEALTLVTSEPTFRVFVEPPEPDA